MFSYSTILYSKIPAYLKFGTTLATLSISLFKNQSNWKLTQVNERVEELQRNMKSSTCFHMPDTCPAAAIEGCDRMANWKCMRVYSLTSRALVEYANSTRIRVRMIKESEAKKEEHTHTYSPKCPAKDIGYHVRDEGEPCDALNKQ